MSLTLLKALSPKASLLCVIQSCSIQLKVILSKAALGTSMHAFIAFCKFSYLQDKQIGLCVLIHTQPLGLTHYKLCHARPILEGLCSAPRQRNR